VPSRIALSAILETFQLIGFVGSRFLAIPPVLGGGPIAFNCGGHPCQLPRAASCLTPLSLAVSLRSRCTAMLAGLRSLIQTKQAPDRYVTSTFFDTIPSAPSRQACAKTIAQSSALCSLTGCLSWCRAVLAPARPCGRGMGDCAYPRHHARSDRTGRSPQSGQLPAGAARRIAPNRRAPVQPPRGRS
jgi:hypothetical protein